jgi:hypothetical protein
MKIVGLVIASQLFLSTSFAWADNDNGRPEISNIGGEDHSPGVTLVIVLALLAIGFGVGLLVGRKTSRSNGGK